MKKTYAIIRKSPFDKNSIPLGYGTVIESDNTLGSPDIIRANMCEIHWIVEKKYPGLWSPYHAIHKDDFYTDENLVKILTLLAT